MPRQMPPFFGVIFVSAYGRPSPSCCGRYVYECCSRLKDLRGEWHISRVELLYELAYVRIFVGMGYFLEQTFCPLSLGYHQRRNVRAGVRQACHPTMGSQANIALLGGRNFQLWHKPDSIILRSQRFFQGGFHENVVASNSST